MTQTDATKTPAKGTNHAHGLSASDRAYSELVNRVAALEARVAVLEKPAPVPAPPPPVEPLPDEDRSASELQALIDGAPAGGTIELPPVNYHGGRVTITKPLIILGAKAQLYGDLTRASDLLWIGASGVTVRGLTVHGNGTAVPVPANEYGAIQIGGYHVGAVNDAFLDGVTVDGSGMYGVHIQGGADHAMRRCVVKDAGIVGIGGWNGTNWAFYGNDISGCNWRGADVGDSASGVKLLHLDGLTFDANHVHDNPARGFWTDTGVTNARITNNRLERNKWNGAFLESSHNLTVTGNVVIGNTREPVARPWGWGGGICLASSDHAVVSGNICAWNGAGITVVSQQRTDDAPHTDISIRDNVIAQDIAGTYGTGWFQDWAGILFNATSRNGGTLNRYYWSTPERYAWNGEYTSLPFYNATPAEDGTYLTRAELDAILSTAGVL